MPAPRVIIVDDQRDISRMLRAALETLGRGFVIVDVPSAEEAQLEFRRGPVDLLITDLRLPGISGLELIRRLHKSSSAARMIVISGYADETARAEFRSLGALFFPKPLDLPAFLKGVQEAVSLRDLAEARQAVSGAEAAAVPAPGPRDGEPPALPERLARLQRDLGALAVLLVDAQGGIAAQSDEAAGLDLTRLLPRLRQALAASRDVAQVLGAQTPTNLHLLDGSAFDLYAADVGEAFALLIVFDGQRGAGQAGLVLRYGRQAADDLLTVLNVPGALTPAAPAGQAPLPASTGEGVQSQGDAAQLNAPAAPPVHKVKTGPLKKKKTGPLTAAAAEPAPVPTAPPPSEPVPPAALPASDPPEKKTTSPEAAAFWDNVDGAGIGDARTGTLSWEEAAKLGLVKGEKPGT